MASPASIQPVLAHQTDSLPLKMAKPTDDLLTSASLIESSLPPVRTIGDQDLDQIEDGMADDRGDDAATSEIDAAPERAE